MRYQRLFPLLIALFVAPIVQAQYQPDWSSLDTRPVPEWYKDAKFGVFIHWGVYSVPAWSPVGSYAEWYQNSLVDKTHDGAVVDYHHKKYGDSTYYQLADRFKAELFNPDAWAQLIERSGARYVVLTSKHHDGFCLWPSKDADRDWGFPWNASEVGPHQDLVGELFKALRKTDVHPGLYYSLYEWYNPLWLKDKDRYVTEHCWPQMKDIITRYKPEVLWTDGDWDLPADRWKSTQFLAWLYDESPVKNTIVTYDRWGSGVRFHHGGVYTPEYQPDLDFGGHYFEESQGMGYSYGYNRAEDAWDYSTAQALVLHLIDLVSRGGNFLLDIGPTADGKIPPIMQERLLQIGQWLSVNGDAIYGTHSWKTAYQWSEGKRDYKRKKGDAPLLLKETIDPDPGYAVKDIFFTAKDDTLFAILPQYPAGGKAVVRGLLLQPGATVTFLQTGRPLPWINQNGHVVVTLPAFDPGWKATYAFVLKISPAPGFAAKPVISASYSSFTANPAVTISTATPGAEIHYTIDGSMPTEASALYSQPILLPHTATVRAIAFHKDMLSSNVATQDLVKYSWQAAVRVKHPQHGIEYRYYEPDNYSLAAIDNTMPVKTGVVPVISLAEKGRAEKFCFAFDGYIRIRKTGMCTFSTISDDGSKLWIDGVEVVDNDGSHGPTEVSGKVALRSGYHKIEVRYFDSGGGNSLEATIQPENGGKKTIDASLLYH